MFTSKIINLNGLDINLQWPEIDTAGFGYMLQDWQKYGPQFVSKSKSRHTIVQAGGNCGFYPLLFSTLFQNVITFEPEPTNFLCLVNNCKTDRIVKINAALSNHCGFITIGNEAPWNVGMAKVGIGDNRCLALTLDSFNLNDVSLIQLDIEGHELKALKGAEKTIKRNKPCLVIEMSQDKNEILEYLQALDYRLVDTFGEPVNGVFLYEGE